MEPECVMSVPRVSGRSRSVSGEFMEFQKSQGLSKGLQALREVSGTFHGCHSGLRGLQECFRGVSGYLRGIP